MIAESIIFSFLLLICSRCIIIGCSVIRCCSCETACRAVLFVGFFSRTWGSELDVCVLWTAGLCAWSPILSLVLSQTCSGASTPLHKATLRAFHSCRSASCHQYHRHCSVQSGACTKSAYPIFCAGCSLMVWCSHVAAAVAVMGTVTYFIALGPCVCSQVNWCIDILLRCTYIYTNIHTYICILVRCQTSYC